jgi:hypothetical protein
VAAQLLAKDTLVLEIFQKKHVAVKGVTVLDLVTLKGSAHLENVT